MSEGLLKRAMDKLSGRGKQVDTAVKKATGKKGSDDDEKKRKAKAKRDKAIADEIRRKRAAREGSSLQL